VSTKSPTRRRSARAGVALALAAAVGLYLSGVGPGRKSAQAEELGGEQQGPSVTLVTGDRITLPVDGAGGPAIRPGAGRRDMQYVISRADGHLQVVPVDALGLLNSGRLDPRLFDVTELLALGFGDDRRADLPLIVKYAGTGGQARLTGDHARVVRRLAAIGGAAMRADKNHLTAFWDNATATGFGKLWLDGQLKSTLDQSVPQIGAPAAWQSGATGAGVTVAVLDTGIDATHPDLAGRVVAEANYDVTLSHLDRTGAPTDAYQTGLVDLENGDYLPVPATPDGTATVRLRAGKYLLRSVVATPLADGTTESSLLVQPVLDPATDQRVNLDARLARPVDARPERASAVSASASVTITQQTGTVGFTDTLWGSDFRGMSTARVGPDRQATGFTSAVVADYAEPGRDGDFTGSPYVYHLAWFQRGTIPTGFRRTVADRDLARVIAAHAAAAPDSLSVSSATASLDGEGSGGAVVYGFPLRGPSTQTEYYTSAPDVRWSSSFIAIAGEQFDQTLRLSAGPRELIAGRTYRETWNQPVFSPSLAAPPEANWYVSRAADRLFLLLPQFSDSAGHRGFTTLRGERYTLYRDGAEVAELVDPQGEPGWEVPLPPESSTYRLEAEARRSPGMPLSSHVTTAWTFRSGHVSGNQPVRLPLSAVRFAPALDEFQRAPAGQPFELPVTIEHQPGSGTAPTARLTVEVSYDDQTWQPVRLEPTASGWTGRLDHPRNTGFVSLRSKATDIAGNTVEQTIIHAYATR
jgi:hypothetical protein